LLVVLLVIHFMIQSIRIWAGIEHLCIQDMFSSFDLVLYWMVLRTLHIYVPLEKCKNLGKVTKCCSQKCMGALSTHTKGKFVSIYKIFLESVHFVRIWLYCSTFRTSANQTTKNLPTKWQNNQTKFEVSYTYFASIFRWSTLIFLKADVITAP